MILSNAQVDVKFTYQIITALRKTGRLSPAEIQKMVDDDDVCMLKSLLKAAANVMEINIRAYLDLKEKKKTK